MFYIILLSYENICIVAVPARKYTPEHAFGRVSRLYQNG
jgi:hypothetical protein